MKITTIGLDLAKNVFQVHGVDDRGKTVLTRQLRRQQMPSFFAKLEPCLIGMEACSGAHFWARTTQFWPRSEAHGTAVCEALRQGKQNRCGRRRSD